MKEFGIRLADAEIIRSDYPRDLMIQSRTQKPASDVVCSRSSCVCPNAPGQPDPFDRFARPGHQIDWTVSQLRIHTRTFPHDRMAKIKDDRLDHVQIL